MSQTRDITLDLERHRQVLEETVSNLRAQLAVWENWYIEYSHLKEEVTTLPEQPPSPKSLARIRRDFESDLITKKEINEIFGKNDLRNPEQILSVLTRRIDYVERNVETLERQLEQAENKLAASSVIAEPDGVVDEESGLPITDIIEEIDEEGNVVNFRLQTGGDVGPKVLEALKTAGVDSLEETGGKGAEPKPPKNASRETANGDSVEVKAELKATPEQHFAQSRHEAESVKVSRAATGVETTEPKKTSDDQKPQKRKSVSFAEKLEVSESNNDQAGDDEPRSRAAQRLDAIMQQARELENMTLASASMPEDESEDDAQLRRDMLAYSASEIGPIVAELELDAGGSDEDEDDEYEFDYTEDEESEDELGRSKHSVISDDYIRRMQELEKRLGVESAFATERAQQLEVPVEGLGQIRVVRPTAEEAHKPADAHVDGLKAGKAAKKGVRFAEELDIADETKTATVLPERSASKKTPEVNPVSEVITERTSRPTPPPPSVAPAKKSSRFKRDRAAGAPTIPLGPLNAPVRFLDEDRSVAPAGPEGKTLADGVLEREPTMTPKDPDELDAALVHQEAAVEYHRMRNRMIQREGGFNKEDDRVVVPLEEEEGGPKKMSRFKAARLSRQ